MKTSYIDYAMSRHSRAARCPMCATVSSRCTGAFSTPCTRTGLTTDKPLQKVRAPASATCSAATIRTATRRSTTRMVRLAQDFSMRYLLVDGPRQLRLRGRRPPGRLPVHRGAPVQNLRRDAARHRQGHRGLATRTLTRRRREPRVLPVALPEPARQRLGRHRRRHGDEHPAAQPRRGHKRLRLRARQPGRHARATSCSTSRARISRRSGIIMGRSGIRAGLRHRPRQASSCAPAPSLRNSDTSRSRIIVTELPYQVNKRHAHREHRRSGARQAARGHLRPARRVRPQRYAHRHRAQDATPTRRSC